MDAVQIFATGGASGLVGLVIFLIFKFLQSRHHLVSKCTKEGITVVADVSTPKNISPPVDVKDKPTEPQSDGSSGTNPSTSVGGGS